MRAVGLAGVLGAAVAGCSSDEPAAASASRLKYQTVMLVPWSKAPRSFARQDAHDALPDGPRSFTVDRQGDVHVLDVIKHRIAVYRKGRMVRYVTLPNQDFVDFDFNHDSGYVLVDTMEHGEVVFVNHRGAVTRRVSLEGQGIDDPKMTTGIAREPTGVWVEQNHATWLLVATGDGEPVTQRAQRRGKVTTSEGHMIQAAIHPAVGVSVRRIQPDGSDRTIKVKAGANVIGLSGFEQDKAGNTYIGMVEVTPGSKSSVAQEKHLLAVVAPNGKVLRYDQMPRLGSTQNTTRTLRKGQDGHLYILVVGTRGVSVMRYNP